MTVRRWRMAQQPWTMAMIANTPRRMGTVRLRRTTVSVCFRILTRNTCGVPQAALTSFDDTGGKELEIEVVTQEVTRLFRKAEVQLQRFGEQQSASEADDKVPFFGETEYK